MRRRSSRATSGAAATTRRPTTRSPTSSRPRRSRQRFVAWREKKETADAEEEAKKPKPPDPIKEAEEALRPPSPISETGTFPLTGSVGTKGDNRPDDVARVAGRLHGLGFLDAMTTDVEVVSEAIERYQSQVLQWPRPDGRVDVDKKTHRALKAGRKTISMQLP